MSAATRSPVPVIAGAAQLANKDEDALVAALDLIAAAVQRACADAHLSTSALAAVYMVPPTVFGESDPASELGARLGLAPGARVVGRFSGAAPQRLVADACRAIAAGTVTTAVVCGGIADASIRQARRRGVPAPGLPASGWSQGSAGPGVVPARRDAVESSVPEMAARVGGPPEIFALIESAIGAGSARTPAEHAEWLGRVMAPFTAVAASRPDVAWFPLERTAAYLSEVRVDNRMIAEPYPKLMTSFPIVDQAAALVLMSEEAAIAAGVPRSQLVYPCAVATCRDPAPPSLRRDMRRSEALERACERVLWRAGVEAGDIGAFDLYSCFPAAVQMATAALGLDPLDGRRLTLTGGLPYFGGPGASYGTHAIASAVERCRDEPDLLALTVGLGGFAGDFGVGLYSAHQPPAPFAADDCADVEAALREHRKPIDLDREGDATVVAHTVVHAHDGPERGCAIVQFADGTMAGATTPSRNTARDIAGSDVIGARVRISRRHGEMVYEL